MEQYIPISNLNDFLFCPASIYFHSLYEGVEKMLYHDRPQITGLHAHQSIEGETYSTSKSILQGSWVVSNELHLVGRIDTYHIDTGKLVERKRKVKHIFDGYHLQLYGQYFCLKEMGYQVESLWVQSMEDNKRYSIPLPSKNSKMYKLFLDVIEGLRTFNLRHFYQTEVAKCTNCIYAPMCDRGISD